MSAGLGTACVVLAVLLWELLRPTLKRAFARAHLAWVRSRWVTPSVHHDPGRERRAEQRARALLRSCVEEEDWRMYRELGFLRVTGAAAGADGDQPDCAYLIYPHRPIVAYSPATHEPLNEYCVEFPDDTRPYGSARLPDSDDVLAKWMALTADAHRLVSEANMHLPGRQVDLRIVRRDLRRLARWEHQREAQRDGGRRLDSLRAA